MGTLPLQPTGRYNADMLTTEKLREDLTNAMRARDEVRKRTLRMVLTAVKLAEVDKRRPLDEGELFGVLNKEVKTRLETYEDAERAGRDDLLGPLDSEIEVLKSYLPQPLSPEELESLAKDAIEEVGASDPREMGKVMKILMPKVQGRADGKTVSGLVRKLLSVE